MPRFERLPAESNLLRQAIKQHPEVVQASREADVAKARSAQSEVAAIPDVGIEVSYGKRADGYEDMAGVMFTVDLPCSAPSGRIRTMPLTFPARWKPTTN